jgi:hypothetical protein
MRSSIQTPVQPKKVHKASKYIKKCSTYFAIKNLNPNYTENTSYYSKESNHKENKQQMLERMCGGKNPYTQLMRM